MQALKASWQVFAGVIPGEPMPEFTRTWHYTSDDYEADQALPPMPEGHHLDPCGRIDQPHMSRFTRMLFAARQYEMELTDPRRVNWVRCEFVWL